MTERTRQSRRQFLRLSLLTGATASLAGCPSQTSEVEVHKSQTPGAGVTAAPDETFESVQRAIDDAMPGDTVRVPPGVYREKVTTVRSGTSEEPIRIVGPESAVLYGDRDRYGVLRINHSHVHLLGLTVEGLLNRDRPGELDSYVSGQLIQTRPEVSSDEYLRDIVIAPHNVGHSRASLIGLERTVDAEIGPTRVSGLAGADYIIGDARSRNGELLYIGTSASNLGADWHPWTEFDETRNVRIHNIDNSAGHPHAEAVDIKEGTRDVTVEYVTDRNAGHVTRGEQAATVSFKSHNSTVRWCDIAETKVGVEFAPGEEVYDNDCYGCQIRDFDVEAIAFQSDAVRPETQGHLCGNQVQGFERPQLTDCPSAVPTSETIGYGGSVFQRNS